MIPWKRKLFFQTVRAKPPVKLSFDNASDGGWRLTWSSPYPSSSSLNKNITYEISYRKDGESDWTVSVTYTDFGHWTGGKLRKGASEPNAKVICLQSVSFNLSFYEIENTRMPRISLLFTVLGWMALVTRFLLDKESPYFEQKATERVVLSLVL